MQHNTRIAEVSWLIEPERELHGHCVSLRPNQPRVREFLFTAADGTAIAVSFGTASSSASQHDRLVRAKEASVIRHVFPQLYQP